MRSSTARVGTVRRIDRTQRSLTAVFDGEEHVFDADDLIDLALGYALTCHRAQGSEADHVIVALPPGRLPDPCWIYTAVTRASAQAVIVGEAGTFATRSNGLSPTTAACRPPLALTT